MPMAERNGISPLLLVHLHRKHRFNPMIFLILFLNLVQLPEIIIIIPLLLLPLIIPPHHQHQDHGNVTVVGTVKIYPSHPIVLCVKQVVPVVVLVATVVIIILRAVLDIRAHHQVEEVQVLLLLLLSVHQPRTIVRHVHFKMILQVPIVRHVIQPDLLNMTMW